ncbi:MAG: hypothetical protein J7577_23650 [Sphingobacteriaceae bacterium]|nr:hypothetical protein [Sphingobacteriaceae bacterium]
MAKLIYVYTVCYAVTLNVWTVPLAINWGNRLKVMRIVPAKPLVEVPATFIGKHPEYHADEHND